MWCSAVERTSSSDKALDKESAAPGDYQPIPAQADDRDVRIRYSILENPPWPECLILGFQRERRMPFDRASDIEQLPA